MAEARESWVDSEFIGPDGEIELTIAKIQAEILDIDRFGRSDSFYDFGGTSLQAIRVCARVEREVGLRAKPAWLLSHDVLADFAACLIAHADAADA